MSAADSHPGPPLPADALDPRTAAKVQAAARSFHLTLLILSLTVLALAALLNVRGETRVALPVLGKPLPELCYWRRLFGVDCPGCGLTRCFISLAHGDVTRAWHYHPTGMLLFAGVVAQVPYRAGQLWRLRSGRREWRIPGWQYLWWGLIALMLGQWVWRTLM